MIRMCRASKDVTVYGSGEVCVREELIPGDALTSFVLEHAGDEILGILGYQRLAFESEGDISFLD